MAYRCLGELKYVTSTYHTLHRNLNFGSSRWIFLSSHFSVEVDDTKNIDRTPSDLKLPDEPTNCCMSGCANCVWIKYAEDLVKGYEDGSDLARKMILGKVEDPNMRAFLEMELRTLTNK